MADNQPHSTRDLEKAAIYSYDVGTDTYVPCAVDATGQTKIANFPAVQATIPSHGATYRAAFSNIATAALATDVFTFIGSATKTVKLWRIILTGVQTTAGQVTTVLAKRSTANSGGTSSTATVVPNDSGSAAGTAVARAYTANPTSTGNLVGNVSSSKVFIPGAATASFAPGALWDFRSEEPGPIVLRGVAETLAISLAGVTVTGGSLSCEFEWTEE